MSFVALSAARNPADSGHIQFGLQWDLERQCQGGEHRQEQKHQDQKRERSPGQGRNRSNDRGR